MADGLLRRALARTLVERDDETLAARLRGHHRHLGARDELPRVRGILGSHRDAGRDGEAPDGFGFELCDLLSDALGESRRASKVSGRKDHCELLAADAADDVRCAHRRSKDVSNLVQELVAHAVAVHVVHPLEVVEVEHHHGDRVVSG